MASGKRLAPSCPDSVPKRICEDSEELVCCICFDLAVDAVQVSCCGALHCRTCISRCTACPMCRSPVVSVLSDFRRERLSAAAIRPCANAGCIFQGMRAAVSAHEDLCEYVPRSSFIVKITKLQSELQGALSAHAAHIESMTNQKTEMQRSLMACALSADPATSALQYLYGAKNVFAVHRAAAHARQYSICFWIESAFVGNIKTSIVPPMERLQQHSFAMELICETLMVRFVFCCLFALIFCCLT
jgi:hypothetical protein